MSTPNRCRLHPALRLGAVAGAVWCVLATPALAQGGATAPEGTKPSVWLEPRVSAGVSLSNNGTLSSTNARSEQQIEVSPGVRAVVNGARVRGFLDYSLSGLYYAQDTSGDNLRQALNASGTVNLWDNRAFVDVSGVIDDQAVSAFSPSPGSFGDSNRSETANFRISPYVKGNLAGLSDYELRYSLETIQTQTSSRSDFTVQALSLALGRQPQGSLLGWSFNGSSQTVDYSVGRTTRSDNLQAGLIVAVTPQLSATLFAGVEANDVLTLERKSYNTTGLSADWRPSTRTRASLSFQDRYFGLAHQLSVQHRTAQTVWSLTDSRNVSDSPLQSAQASLGSIYNLLDNLLAATEPDPVARARLVEAELLNLGLPADTQIFRDFLTSSATVERAQSLSVALVGRRSAITFALTRSSSSRLQSLINLGDDFDSSSEIVRRGWSLNLAHRLTPLTSLSATLSAQTTDGSGGGGISQSSRDNSISLGLSTRLAPRTSATFQVRRTTYGGSAFSDFNETGISGLLTHRF